jgi:hypothetical protein
MLKHTEFLQSKAIPQLNKYICTGTTLLHHSYLLSCFCQWSIHKLNTDTSVFTCDILQWLQPKLGSATHITSWVKQTSCVYSNKATCFAFLKPSLGHQNINRGKYANIYSSIFFSSHDISYLTLTLSILALRIRRAPSNVRLTNVAYS